MDKIIPDGVTLSDLKIIKNDQGDLLHCMKSSSEVYSNFGEAYFSEIKSGAIKSWKRHNQMVLNIVVPLGKIKFVIYDDRKSSSTKHQFHEVILSKDNYKRLTVSPGLWMAFKGLSKDLSMLINIANIEHDDNEVDRKSIDEIPYNWG